jgi:hypothetical protein
MEPGSEEMKKDLKRLDAKYEVKQKKGMSGGMIILVVLAAIALIIGFAAAGLAP